MADSDFLEEFPVEEDPLNGLTFQGIYIPQEVLLKIFSNLSPPEILKCSLVCKNWFNIAKSNALWQTIYNRKERPKKAQNLPWYVFYCYFTTNYFENLIQNGNGEEGLDHWEVESGKFEVLELCNSINPFPLDMPEFHEYNSHFHATSANCFKYQKIDLKPKTLLRYIIRKHKPVLYASDWYTSFSETSALYELKIICDKKGVTRKWNHLKISKLHGIAQKRLKKLLGALPYSKSVQRKIEEPDWCDPPYPPWKKVEILYENYPAEIESVYFYHLARFKRGLGFSNGSKMTGGVLKFLFDSIKPTY